MSFPLLCGLCLIPLLCNQPTGDEWLDVGALNAPHASKSADECGILLASAEEWLKYPLDKWNEPYVIRFNHERQKLFTAAMQRTKLLDAMAEERVTLSSSNTHSYNKQEMQFDEYLQYIRNQVSAVEAVFGVQYRLTSPKTMLRA